MKIFLLLNGCPISTQHLYSKRGKVTFMKKDAKLLKYKYIQQIKNQIKLGFGKSPLYCECTYYFGDARKRDIDNYLKLVLDSMQGIVFDDDRYIQKLLIEKKIDRQNPRIEFMITDEF